MLGLDNAGKTTILKKLSDEDITTIMPTQASTQGLQGLQGNPEGSKSVFAGMQMCGSQQPCCAGPGSSSARPPTQPASFTSS